MEFSEEQIKKALRDKIKFHQIQIDKCKKALDAFGESLEKQIDNQPTIFDEIKTQDRMIISKRTNTLRAKIENILVKKNTPMTSRELMEEINQLYGKAYDFNNFSGNFSQLYRKQNSNIKKYEIDNVPNEFKTVYGLKNWFTGDELKLEYVNDFLNRHSQ